MSHFSTSHIRDQAERVLAQYLRPRIYRDREPVTVAAWEAPGEPVAFEEARIAAFTAKGVDEPWGRPWGTTWFHVHGTVPERWAGAADAEVELIADIGFTPVQSGFQCEALAYDKQGRVLKGVEPHNRWVALTDTTPGAAVEVYLEAASNPDVINQWSFEPMHDGTPAAMSGTPQYRTREIALGLRDTAVAYLVGELEALLGLAREIGESSTRGTQIMGAVAEAVRAVDPEDVAASAPTARAELAGVLSAPAHHGAHQVAAVGHAHIDSAWLWPIRETARKVARTFSNVLDLLDRDPDFTFAASSAQQYLWLKQTQPELFERLRLAVAGGRFVPVGGMWVESDTNMPGGEALVRQFVEGNKFFSQEFGTQPAEAWLPDSFGYSAAMPQIALLSGARWFLTQKLSWNETNRMPHHTFWWEGIDGSRVYTHFPPADTYGSDLSAKDIHRSERQYSEKPGANQSLLLFGYGDGGGGPTREMLETARRTSDLAGSPRVDLTGPRQFFADAQREYPRAPVWNGEMYLEFHRGVFTSQAAGKDGNRRSEALLHEAELWAATAALRVGAEYPHDALERIWRQVLLYQFHDILPGTSIEWVHDEVAAGYERLQAELEDIIGTAVAALTGPGDRALSADAAPVGAAGTAFGIVPAPQPPAPAAVRTLPDGGFELVSRHAAVVVAGTGRITSAVDRATGREVIAAAGGNTLELFRDQPTTWDAWNLDSDYELGAVLLEATRVAVDGDAVVVTTSTGRSAISQRISLAHDRPAILIDTDVDWHESQKLLKLGFNLDVHAERSTSEIQFGHVHRSLHRNTSWDAARYEIPAHRWVHVGETGYGIALANRTTYGHDVTRGEAAGDATTTTRLRASLLRAPRYPDPDADAGRHSFSHVLRLGASICDAIDEGYRLNAPPRTVIGARTVAPIATVAGGRVRIETVKLAEDRSGDLVLRLYESLGGRATTKLTVDTGFTRAWLTDLHENLVEELEVVAGDAATTVDLKLRSFQILTVRLARG